MRMLATYSTDPGVWGVPAASWALWACPPMLPPLVPDIIWGSIISILPMAPSPIMPLIPGRRSWMRSSL